MEIFQPVEEVCGKLKNSISNKKKKLSTEKKLKKENSVTFNDL